MNKNRMRVAGALAAVVVAGTGVAAAQSASATNYTSCASGATACFWYAANNTGAVAGYSDARINNLNLKNFNSGGSGSGTQVGDNAHSAKNRTTDHTVLFYKGQSLAGGVPDSYGPGESRNFASGYVNNVESYQSNE